MFLIGYISHVRPLAPVILPVKVIRPLHEQQRAPLMESHTQTRAHSIAHTLESLCVVVVTAVTKGGRIAEHQPECDNPAQSLNMYKRGDGRPILII